MSSPERFAAHAVEAGAAVDVVIGHSGAGAVLPLVAAAGGWATVYIDAVVPPIVPSDADDAPFFALLEHLPTDDGLLPPWDEWWPPGVMADLVPDPAARHDIVAELPRLPRRFYDRAPDLPPCWWEQPAAYLRLSPAYAAAGACR